MARRGDSADKTEVLFVVPDSGATRGRDAAVELPRVGGMRRGKKEGAGRED